MATALRVSFRFFFDGFYLWTPCFKPKHAWAMKPEVLKSWTLEIDYSRALCLGADQKTRGLWERDWPLTLTLQNLRKSPPMPHPLVPQTFSEVILNYSAVILALCRAWLQIKERRERCGAGYVWGYRWLMTNLVPRVSFPLTSGRKTRALGATILK